MYYHALTGLLAHYAINWYGERSMVTECEFLATDVRKMVSVGIEQQKFTDMLGHVRLFMDEKNIANLEHRLDEKDLSVLISYYEVDKEIIDKIVNVIQ